MDVANLLRGAINANQENIREMILQLKDESKIPSFLAFLENPTSAPLYEAARNGIEANHPNSHLITGIVLQNEANIYLRKNSFVSVINALISSSHALGRFNGANEQKYGTAKRNAEKRHLETYALRNEVVQYWKNNIDPKLSADKAAEILAKHFSPLLSFRKLSEYVSNAKKLPPASTV